MPMIRDVAPRVMRWVLKDRGECSRGIFAQLALRYSGEMPVVLHPRLTLAAESDPMLAYMIQRGMPLTREQWISLMWPVGPPKPWCIEHEVEVPEFWQRPELVEAEEEEEFGAQTPWRPRKTPATPSEEVK